MIHLTTRWAIGCHIHVLLSSLYPTLPLFLFLFPLYPSYYYSSTINTCYLYEFLSCSFMIVIQPVLSFRLRLHTCFSFLALTFRIVFLLFWPFYFREKERSPFCSCPACPLLLFLSSSSSSSFYLSLHIWYPVSSLYLSISLYAYS